MKTYSYPDVKTVIICGDIHGNFEGIVHKLCVQFGCTDTLLIVAGDCVLVSRSRVTTSKSTATSTGPGAENGSISCSRC
jgi:hypothetical protein